jgi:hypothetical protein
VRLPPELRPGPAATAAGTTSASRDWACAMRTAACLQGGSMPVVASFGPNDMAASVGNVAGRCHHAAVRPTRALIAITAHRS